MTSQIYRDIRFVVIACTAVLVLAVLWSDSLTRRELRIHQAMLDSITYDLRRIESDVFSISSR